MSTLCVHCRGRVVDPRRIFKAYDPETKCPYCGELYRVKKQEILEEVPSNLLVYFMMNKKETEKIG